MSAFESFDLAIVGSGMIGAAAARHAANGKKRGRPDEQAGEPTAAGGP